MGYRCMHRENPSIEKHDSPAADYEWDSYIPRFGLVDVDFKTFKRTPKQSAYFYKEVIERNGIDRDLLLKYLPEFKDWKIYTSNDNVL